MLPPLQPEPASIFHDTVNASITQSMLSLHSQCFHYTANASITQSILPLRSQELLALSTAACTVSVVGQCSHPLIRLYLVLVAYLLFYRDIRPGTAAAQATLKFPLFPLPLSKGFMLNLFVFGYKGIQPGMATQRMRTKVKPRNKPSKKMIYVNRRHTPFKDNQTHMQNYTH